MQIKTIYFNKIMVSIIKVHSKKWKLLCLLKIILKTLIIKIWFNKLNFIPLKDHIKHTLKIFICIVQRR